MDQLLEEAWCNILPPSFSLLPLTSVPSSLHSCLSVRLSVCLSGSHAYLSNLLIFPPRQFLSLTFDGVTGAIQERLRRDYTTSAFQMMFAVNVYSCVYLSIGEDKLPFLPPLPPLTLYPPLSLSLSASLSSDWGGGPVSRVHLQTP